MAARLESRIKSLIRAGKADPGRGTLTSFEESVEEIRARLDAAGLLDSGYAGGGATHTEDARLGELGAAQLDAVRVEASAVDLPVLGATFDAAPWMSDDTREAYVHPETLECPASVETVNEVPLERSAEPALPHPAVSFEEPLPGRGSKLRTSRKFRLSAREEKELCGRLDVSRMLFLVPEDEAIVGAFSNPRHDLPSD